MPRLLLIPVALFAITPLLYIAIRAAAAEPSVWMTLIGTRIPKLLLSTALLAVLVTAGVSVLGAGTALAVERTTIPFKGLWRTLLALPVVVPPYVTALSVVLLFGTGGALQRGLGFPALNPFGLWGAAFVLTASTFPYVFLLTSAALRDADPSFTEAARVAGRGPWSRFLSVTLPTMRPGVVAGGLLALLYVLSDFGAVAVMRYRTFTVAVYEQITARYDRSGAAALSLVLVLITIPILVIHEWVRRRPVIGGTRRGEKIAVTSRTRGQSVLSISSILVVTLVSVGIPISALVWWITSFPTGADEPVILYTLQGIGVSAVAATLVMAAAVPVVLAGPGRLTKLLRASVIGAFALPGVVIALAVTMILVRLPLPVYGTAAAVVVAYILRFLPQAVAAGESGVSGISKSLWEAGSVLGRGPGRVFTSVTFPLMRPHLMGGWLLVFLSCLKELPATLLLRPPGFETLATRIWVHSSQGGYGRAAVPATILILTTSVPLAILLWRGNIPLGGPTKAS